MKIAVIDGQIGSTGTNIIEELRSAFGKNLQIVAFGTNALATAAMLSSGANEGATGENAIVRNVVEVDLIVGSLGVIIANSYTGEITPRMAEAIASSKARKLLLPLADNGVDVVGAKAVTLPDMAAELIAKIKMDWKNAG